MKFNINLLIISILLTSTIGCRSIHKTIEINSEEIFSDLVEIRRDFHQYPELAGHESRTSEIIANYLTNLGLEVKKGIAGNGVIGILKGEKEGKSIAWRADMDAIPNYFPDYVPFKSKFKGIQHGCGHDVHMAIGLGIAEVLSMNKKSLNGTFYFIFQPEEESFVGAKNIVESDLYSELEIDEIYALHVTNLPVGQIVVKSNELYAYQKIVKIKFNSALSKKDVKALHSQIKTEVQRKKVDSSPWDVLNAFNPTEGIKHANTIFRDYLFINEHYFIDEDENEFSLVFEAYETNKSNLISIIPKIQKVINESEHKDKFISISYIQENPTVLNNQSLTYASIKTLTDIYQSNPVLVSYGQIPYFNDDFIYFQQQTPGVYFLLGGSNIEKGIVAMNHAPNFRVDEECIKIGVKSFASLIVERSK